MTIEKNFGAKRRYSAPKLVVYGDMAKLTKGGTGSIVESGNSNVNRRS